MKISENFLLVFCRYIFHITNQFTLPHVKSIGNKKRALKTQNSAGLLAACQLRTTDEHLRNITVPTSKYPRKCLQISSCKKGEQRRKGSIEARRQVKNFPQTPKWIHVSFLETSFASFTTQPEKQKVESL